MFVEKNCRTIFLFPTNEEIYFQLKQLCSEYGEPRVWSCENTSARHAEKHVQERRGYDSDRDSGLNIKWAYCVACEAPISDLAIDWYISDKTESVRERYVQIAGPHIIYKQRSKRDRVQRN